MTRARKELINLQATPFYHVVSRCVRRTFLCGQDFDSGKDYSHRKQWIVARMKALAQIFSIKIAAYAVMSNHYHLVLYVDQKLVETWDNQQIIQKCKMIFPHKGKELEDMAYIDDNSPILSEALDLWRERLSSVSWFMRCLNEPIARWANKEEDCTGHFWEGRFKSQALLDQGAVLSAMAYVDLNPIRAGLSDRPETSDFTSIQERINTYKKFQQNSNKQTQPQPLALMALNIPGTVYAKEILSISLRDYLRLVDETGKVIRADKKGAISKQLDPILERVGIRSSFWIEVTKTIESHYAQVVGSEEKLIDFLGYKRLPKGASCSRRLYLALVS